MLQTRYVVIGAVLVLGVLGAVAWQSFKVRDAGAGAVATAPTSAVSVPQNVTATATAKTSKEEIRFVDSATRFSFILRKGFEAQEFPVEKEAAAIAVIVQNTVGQGVEIVVRPLVKNAPMFSEDSVRGTVPTEKMTNFKSVSAAGTPAFSFDTNNPIWDGASHEVWFEKDGFLYQLSSYARSAPLVEDIRSTWHWGEWWQ